MSTTIVLVVVIPLLVAMAALVTWITARRSETSAFGTTAELDRTVRRRTEAPAHATATAPTGREVEAAAALARIEGAGIESVAETPVALPAWTPPDPEKLGVTRRQFLNRASLGLTGLGLSGFGAATLSFLWPKAGGGWSVEAVLPRKAPGA